MKVQYLGTAAAEGWPGLFCHCSSCERARAQGGKDYRSRSQVLIDSTLLVDFGPDTFYHAQQQRLDLAQVTTVLLTHSHTDHFYPTELILRGLPYATEREQNPLLLYGNAKCEAMFQRMLEEEDDSKNLRDCVGFRRIRPLEVLCIPGYRILPLVAQHDPAECCMLYVIRSDDGSCMLYGNDTAYFPEETWAQLAGLRFHLVSLDCTHGKTPDSPGHMGLSGNRLVKERLLAMGCAGEDTTFVLTHFSHNGGLLHKELEHAVHGENFQIAYDGMRVDL
ncbi:MAG: MBL fold metallo-hydrolase [Angelakisella sp.]